MKIHTRVQPDLQHGGGRDPRPVITYISSFQ